MPTIADVIMNVESLKADRAARFDHLVDVLSSGDADVDVVEVDEICSNARKSMRDLASAVDRLVARKEAAAVVATAEAAQQAKGDADANLKTVTAAADLELKKVRERHATELRAAITAHDAKTVAASNAVEVAAAALGEVEKAREHLRTTAAPALLARVGDLRVARDAEVAKVEAARLAIKESERICEVNPLIPERDERLRPFGGTSNDIARNRRDEQRARSQAATIHDREKRNVANYTAGIAEAEQQVAKLDQEIVAAERELLVP